MTDLINKYVADKGITLTEFARRADMSKELLIHHRNRIRAGKPLKPEIATAIEKASDGAINAIKLSFPGI